MTTWDVGRHHRHASDRELTKPGLTGLFDLIEEFRPEVTEIYARRTD